MRRRRTIAREASAEGVGLFGGRPVHVVLRPAPAETGIVFRRVDLDGAPDIPALVTNVAAGETRSTTLRNGEAEVCVVEHLLSAAYGLGIDDLIVEMNGPEMPAGDGSALTCVRWLQEAGASEQDTALRPRVVTRPVTVEQDGARVTAEAHPDGLRITFTLDYGDRFIGVQSRTFDLTPEAYVAEIAPARTYVLAPEIQPFLDMGLGRGASLENLIVVEEDGRIRGEQRFADERVRHKIIDVLGDLALLGRPLQARVTAYRSGHALNAELARRLAEGEG